MRWEDMVFENRNRNYGAYVLRKSYSDQVIRAFIVTVVILALALLYPRIKKFFEEPPPPAPPAKQIKYNDLVAPPPINPDTPPPPKIDLPKPPEAIKFVPPKVTEKEVVEDEIPEMKELMDKPVATETSTGTEEVIFEEVVPDAIEDKGEDPNKIYTIVEQQPEFPGGVSAMMKFIGQNLKYPPQARRMDIAGSVFVEFVVNAEGDISDARVIKGIGGGCDEEALRVISKMPRWRAGKQNGKAVRVKFVLPLKFVLN